MLRSNPVVGTPGPVSPASTCSSRVSRPLQSTQRALWRSTVALAVVGDRHQQPTVAPSSPPCEASARLQPEAGPSTSVCNVSASLPHAGVGRRGGLAAAGGALLAGPLASLCLPGSAAAMRTVTLRDGTVVEAFEHGMSLSIVCLRGSVPAQWIVEYRQTLGKYAGFSLGQRNQVEDIFSELGDAVSKPNSCRTADVVSLGDAWLGPAISRGYLQPLPGAEGSRWWRSLPPRWQALLRRDPRTGRPDPRGGQVFGAPYRWGATLIAVRQDKLTSAGGAPVLDWPDLLQPRLKGRLAVIDASHEFVAIALKSLGLSANTRASQLSAAGVSYSMLQQRVAALWAQTRLFSSRDHIRALQAGDVWAVVGWSSDLVGVAERSNNISVIAPASGATLWADLWTVPAGAKGGHRQSGPSPLLPSWIEFALQPARIPSLPGLKTGASPLLLPDLPPPAAPSPSPPLQPSSSGFRLFGRGGRQHASSSSSKAADAGQVPAASASASGSGGVTATPADVRLRPGQYYMPPAPLLQRSEFLLPLDDDTRELYRKLLESLNK